MKIFDWIFNKTVKQQTDKIEFEERVYKARDLIKELIDTYVEENVKYGNIPEEWSKKFHNLYMLQLSYETDLVLYGRVKIEEFEDIDKVFSKIINKIQDSFNKFLR